MENFEDLYAGASCLMMLTTLPVNSPGGNGVADNVVNGRLAGLAASKRLK